MQKTTHSRVEKWAIARLGVCLLIGKYCIWIALSESGSQPMLVLFWVLAVVYASIAFDEANLLGLPIHGAVLGKVTTVMLRINRVFRLIIKSSALAIFFCIKTFKKPCSQDRKRN